MPRARAFTFSSFVLPSSFTFVAHVPYILACYPYRAQPARSTCLGLPSLPQFLPRRPVGFLPAAQFPGAQLTQFWIGQLMDSQIPSSQIRPVDPRIIAARTHAPRPPPTPRSTRRALPRIPLPDVAHVHTHTHRAHARRARAARTRTRARGAPRFSARFPRFFSAFQFSAALFAPALPFRFHSFRFPHLFRTAFSAPSFLPTYLFLPAPSFVLRPDSQLIPS